MKAILKTERLCLRVFSPDDLDAFAAIEADPEVMRFYTSGPRPREQVQRNIAWFIEMQMTHGYSLWAVVHEGDERLIGYCGLIPQTIDGAPEIEVGYKLARAYWGQGLATEAAQAVRAWGFEHLDVPRLISIIDPGNTASIRVAEKNGMTFAKKASYDGKTCHIYTVNRPLQG